jgi:hypothetical protein
MLNSKALTHKEEIFGNVILPNIEVTLSPLDFLFIWRKVVLGEKYFLGWTEV